MRQQHVKPEGGVLAAAADPDCTLEGKSWKGSQRLWWKWGSMNEYIHKRMSECTHSGSKWQVACMNKYKPTVGSLWGSLCSWKAAKTRAPPNVPCLDGVSSSGHSTGSFFTHIREGFPEICASVPYILCSCSPPNTPIYLFGIYRSF